MPECGCGYSGRWKCERVESAHGIPDKMAESCPACGDVKLVDPLT